MATPIEHDGVRQMLKHIWELPSQLQYCLEQDMETFGVINGVKNVVVTGMGGSAIGGDVLRCCMERVSTVPVMVNRDYRLPSFVGRDSLVMAVSYSGNTEETLESFEDGCGRGAKMVAVTTGGELETMAKDRGVPLVKIPSGLPPRAALGYLFAPMALLIEKWGLARGFTPGIRETIDLLREMREELSSEDENLARNLARELKDRIPVIWTAGSFLEVTGIRWKGQINENAKAPAYCNRFPELNHNEFTGFEGPVELTKKIRVVVLTDRDLSQRMINRIRSTVDILRDRVDGFSTVTARGESDVARLFSLMYVGDFTSVYLAASYGVDPVPVTLIEELKSRLKAVS